MTEWAKSAVYISRYHFIHGGGDLIHARDLMEVVASSQAEEVQQAGELLRKIRQALAVKSQNETEDLLRLKRLRETEEGEKNK